MDSNTKEIKISLTFVRHGRSEGNQGGLIQVPRQTSSRFLSGYKSNLSIKISNFKLLVF